MKNYTENNSMEQTRLLFARGTCLAALPAPGENCTAAGMVLHLPLPGGSWHEDAKAVSDFFQVGIISNCNRNTNNYCFLPAEGFHSFCLGAALTVGAEHHAPGDEFFYARKAVQQGQRRCARTSNEQQVIGKQADQAVGETGTGQTIQPAPLAVAG